MKEHIEVEYNNMLLRGYHENVVDDKVVIITHGIGGNKLGHKFVFKQMADCCAQAGISSLRIDFAGHGESDGLFEDTIHSNQVEQLKAIIDKARNELGYKQIYLCSTTIGCYSVWKAASDDLDIEAVINWNPITNFTRYYENAKSKVLADGTLDYNGLYSKPCYIEDLAKLDRTVPDLKMPVLMLQGELDKEYQFEDARVLCQARNWHYKPVEGGNHLWEGIAVRQYLFKQTIDFIKEN